MEASQNERGATVMSRKWKMITSCVIWYCTFTLGLGVGFIGPSLVELSRKFDTDIPTLSKVFTVVTIAFLVGAIICGILFNYLNRQLTSAVLLIIMGIGTLLMPFVPSLPIFFVVAALVGFGAAGYDTAQIVWIIEMWESNAAAYIQTQHFSFALGTFVSPLLMKSFLPRDDPITFTPATEFDLKSNFSAQRALNSTYYALVVQPEHKSSSKFYVPFIIGGAAGAFGGLMIVILYFIKKYEKPNKLASSSGRVEKEGENEGGKSSNCNSRKVLLIMLSAAVLGAYQGMELCSMQFLPAFTHFIDLKLSQPDGALVLSGLTGAFTIGRAVGIFIVLKVRPEILLLGNIILVAIGNTLLLFFANSSITVLWVGVVILGIGFSTVFPSFYGYIEKHLKVSNVVGATMIVAGGLVSGLYPIIIGEFISHNPTILMYTNYFSLVLCTAAFVVIYCITNKKTDKRITYAISNATGTSTTNNGDEMPLKDIKS